MRLIFTNDFKMIAKEKIKELQGIARKLRQHIVQMTCAAASGHPGGSLSAADIITVLYFYKMRHNPKDPAWPDRDRLVMSKGHAAPVLYAALAEAGYFPVKYLNTLRKIGSSLQGHVDMLMLPGVEMSTGSLGQGLSAANGMALAGRLDKKKYRVYAVLGDGECHEGQVWEAAMTASHYKLDNVCAIIDFNKLQIDGFCCDIKDMGPYTHKWKDFGWNPIEVDGHDIAKLMGALDEAEKIKGRPTVIIAHTIKGKGVSFVENKVEWHGIAPKKEEYDRAMAELDEALTELNR